MIDPVQFASVRVLVVGDVMLDRYWFGPVERISPEAPVPVLLVDREELRAGGAANVALNIAALGGQSSICSVVGNDSASELLNSILQDAGVDASLIQDPAMSTTEKLRLVARNQQLLRVDRETRPDHEILAGVLERLESKIREADVLILSDYGKGGLGHIDSIMRIAREHDTPVCIDPKGADYRRYRGAAVVTPNRKEFEEVVGVYLSEDDFQARGQALCSDMDLRSLLVTRSEQGMTLFSDAGDILHSPARAKEVYDVSGAGDTVIAALALAMGAGASMEDALAVANEAAGIVVGKLGTATVSAQELKEALEKRQ